MLSAAAEDAAPFCEECMKPQLCALCAIDGLYLAFPFLLLAPRYANLKPRIAPVLLWPVRLEAELGRPDASGSASTRSAGRSDSTRHSTAGLIPRPWIAGVRQSKRRSDEPAASAI